MNSLQIPDSSPSRVSRPVSVSVSVQSPSQSQSQSHAQSQSQPQSRRQQRASHQVISPTHQSQSDEAAHANSPAYRDVYSHPAAVAYATAHPRRTIPKFGPYLLLQTLGEGEFGKVKLGLHCQWGEEVAVKLIRRGSVDSSLRMSKVEREIEVLRTLKHPNIVRLYDVIETDKYIGIILEYASGGELFDHILAHRYLKEKDAAKLFSQLVSGVWYIHQKKIVHRDLKLENLLLDRHRNVIITDFGFANRFEHRSDDLMQTSCGSPCYAAPELVISEGLYVGSAVDIWSCGVILYAMLAGYLPFDDDPANPDGDNINLLYKYIVNTPLSFPDYVSPEARDLLSMMLVPDPTRRADLRSIMAHPWLAAYAHSFSKVVEDLERAAMEQHQMKRLAYQRQMRQAAAAASQQEPARVARTQSARVDGMLSVSGVAASGAGAAAAAAAAAQPRSHSFRDNTQPHPEYLYETSLIDQSIYSSPSPPTHPPNASSRHPASLAVSPTSPIDDDPFAPPPSVNIPVTISTPDDAPVVSIKDAHPTTAAGTTATGTAPAQPDPKKKGPSGFRHTIQVEYPGDPRAPEPSPPALGTAKPPPSSSSRERKASSPRVAAPVASASGASPVAKDKDRSKEKNKTPQRPTVDVAHHSPASHHVKTPPAPGRNSTSTMRDRDAVQPQTPTFAVSPASPPGTATMDDKSAQSGTGSPGSRSGSGSGSSRHRKGLSIDKFGLGKIFGSSSDHSNANANGYAASRVPSETEVIPEKPLPADPPASASASTIGAAPAASLAIPDAAPQSQSKTSLLSPTPSDVAKEKKNRRNTLTVMVEPFSRTIKNRKGKTPTGETPAKASLATTPITTTTTTSTTTPAGPSPAQAHRQTAIFPSMGGKDAHSSSDNPASTIKARNVMQWFRRRSGVKPDVEDMSGVGDVSTSTSATGKARNGEQPQQTRPAHGDTSFSFSRAGWRFTTSSLVASAATGAGSMGSAAAAAAKDVLRIHHGAVDQTTITTRPPPEVMKRICQVLDELGMEFKAESEYKYRCVRAKRKKAGGSVGLGFSGVVGSNGLAAFTMVGSAASNGVDRRGLPVPSNPSPGGMLKGLLMRRQSSQVSGPPAAPVDVDENAPSPTDASPSGANGGVEPIYGDTTQDAGDEVRFSVELTRIDRLKDTYSLDIRRLKGNLRSYKFLYDTIREKADLQRER